MFFFNRRIWCSVENSTRSEVFHDTDQDADYLPEERVFGELSEGSLSDE